MCKITDASKQVYNMDESGLNTVPDDKEKIISEKNKKHVGKISSAERGTTVTVIACINAAGNVLPPAFVFPRVRKNPAFLHGMVEEYPQCKLFCNESGYSNSYIFLEWMKHFIAEVRPSKDFPVILLLDNHASHLNYDALVLAKANSVHMITIPPHSSHKVQPLDVGFFAPLKTYWAQAVNDYLMLHPGETVDIKKVCSIFKPAFKKVLHPDYGKNAFKETGLWPFDRNKFTEKLFLPSMVTDQNLNEQDLEDFSENEDDNLNGIDELPIFENDVEAPRGSQVVIKAVETIPQSVNFEPMMEIPETSQQDLHDVVPQTFDLDIPVLYEEDLDEELHSQLTKFDAISNPSDFVNIIDIYAYPKVKNPKKRRESKAMQAAVVTSSPELLKIKNKKEEMDAKRTQIQERKKANDLKKLEAAKKIILAEENRKNTAKTAANLEKKNPKNTEKTAANLKKKNPKNTKKTVANLENENPKKKAKKSVMENDQDKPVQRRLFDDTSENDENCICPGCNVAFENPPVSRYLSVDDLDWILLLIIIFFFIHRLKIGSSVTDVNLGGMKNVQVTNETAIIYVIYARKITLKIRTYAIFVFHITYCHIFK